MNARTSFHLAALLVFVWSNPLFGQLSSVPVEPAGPTPTNSGRPVASAAPDPSAVPLPTHIYRLTEAASFTEGCFDWCACPVWWIEDFRGTMRIDEVPSANPFFEVYRVSEVNWLLGAGDTMFRMTGEGTYRTGGAGTSRVQELTLDLKRAEDAEVEHFDSGLIPGGTGGEFPAINILVNKNNEGCFDTRIGVVARPVPRTQLQPWRLTPESTHEVGCLPPCMCPVLLSGPVLGRFDLIRIYTLGDVAEYAVVNIDWRILPYGGSPSTTAGTPVSGFGVYRAQNLGISPLPVQPNHEARLDLNVGGVWDLYQSGWVPDNDRPNIVISVAKNGFYCYDEVFGINAHPGP